MREEGRDGRAGQDPVDVPCVAAAHDDEERESRRVGQDPRRSAVDRLGRDDNPRVACSDSLSSNTQRSLSRKTEYLLAHARRVRRVGDRRDSEPLDSRTVRWKQRVDDGRAAICVHKREGPSQPLGQGRGILGCAERARAAVDSDDDGA